ncbi:uncharacterized protein LOC113535654 isoform X1 [Pangasianodon hypophthalmus]|uniref:uncharacterized protein LOC113535654 isoform X1 n=1 Tax=Pangasianodon hypophthalmus TaxID=310915 RepID=UPI002308221B|nr:uncharacterized protein LOC113535654 isoform X1 [Pangasianodon hypophthalmus]XP_053095978.1 uncharacterized protein LOC113535654 isoform X1 [Pangasianodon hypophthalmus]XP_053095979.1 uncharacterized protein LOC113535654 isoform X1 [Pangasianodon hypophthalmus]XP_053095980.1 uncharacterized protein LOC113535654 isoform X1 [Pangasianodon hypophthalmus]XP_053095981.1 uncharacterized protein LOC113535654 isoform X1 [Pangasianodon hypophthalmus]XP_053095982.1 uncharacterized protein LOC11353565
MQKYRPFVNSVPSASQQAPTNLLLHHSFLSPLSASPSSRLAWNLTGPLPKSAQGHEYWSLWTIPPQWQGPYTVLEWVSPVNYRPQQTGKCTDTQVYQINLLKKWTDPDPNVSTLALLSTDLSKRALVHQGEELTPAQSQELREMADQFADGFSSVPGRTHLVQHDIKTPLGVVVRQQPYCVPAAHCQAIEEEVHQMLQDRIIKESSPIVLVPKPDGSIWLCNDFWRLNWVSDFNAYPLPGPGGVTVERRFISTLDLTKGYWQVALNHYLRQPLAVPGSPLQAAWGASYVPVTHGHRLETPQALYSHVHRRCGNTFLHLVRPPLPPDGRVGTPEVWANHQPKKMSPGVNGGTVPEVPHRPRTTHVTREEDLGGA